MDIYSYLNSKSVADYCRNLGYKFNAYESAFIINDCRRISLEEKHRLIEEVMRTMPDEHPGQLKRNDLSDSFFENAAALIEAERGMLAGLREGQGLVFSYKYRSDRFNDSIESRQLYSTFDKALEAVRAENEGRWDGEDMHFEIVARQPDSEYEITADLTDDYEVCRLWYPDDTMLCELYDLIASDAIRRERDYRQSFPGWDYTDEAYKNAGIEDILAKRRLWEGYDRERYKKDDE